MDGPYQESLSGTGKYLKSSTPKITVFMIIICVTAVLMAVMGYIAVFYPNWVGYRQLILIFCIGFFIVLAVAGWFLKIIPSPYSRTGKLTWLLYSIAGVILSLSIMSQLAGEVKPWEDFDIKVAYSFQSILTMWASSVLLIAGIAFFILYKKSANPSSLLIEHENRKISTILWVGLSLASVLVALSLVIFISQIHGLIEMEEKINAGSNVNVGLSSLSLKTLIAPELLVSVSAIFVAALLLLISLAYGKLVKWSVLPLITGYAIYSTILLLGYGYYSVKLL